MQLNMLLDSYVEHAAREVLLTTVGQSRSGYDILLLLLEPSCLFRALDQGKGKRRGCVP